MKTIKEESELIRKNSLFLLGVSKSIDYVTCADREQLAFEKGVEFAQRWIPIEEELPTPFESGEWDGLRSDFVIAKDSDGNWEKARTYSGIIDGHSFIDWADKYDYGIKNVTHWRPIERK